MMGNPSQCPRLVNISPVTVWCNQILTNLSGSSITYVGREYDLILHSNSSYPFEEFSLSIPPALHVPFIEKFKKLTGHAPPTFTYLYTLIYRGWRTQMVPVDGVNEPIGWTFCVSHIPKN